MPKKNLDELDQQLIEAILNLDVDGVKRVLRAGANVVHSRKRDVYPIGPSVTPVMLSHRMKDLVVAKHEIKMFRRFPDRVLACAKERLSEFTESLGADEVEARIEAICEMIAKKLGRPKI